jgi:hypothetical protein
MRAPFVESLQITWSSLGNFSYIESRMPQRLQKLCATTVEPLFAVAYQYHEQCEGERWITTSKI